MTYKPPSMEQVPEEQETRPPLGDDSFVQTGQQSEANLSSGSPQPKPQTVDDCAAKSPEEPKGQATPPRPAEPGGLPSSQASAPAQDPARVAPRSRRTSFPADSAQPKPEDLRFDGLPHQGPYAFTHPQQGFSFPPAVPPLESRGPQNMAGYDRGPQEQNFSAPHARHASWHSVPESFTNSREPQTAGTDLPRPEEHMQQHANPPWSPQSARSFNGTLPMPHYVPEQASFPPPRQVDPSAQPAHRLPPFTSLNAYENGAHQRTEFSSGYESLASRLAGNADGMSLTPLYRRYKTLSHRLLLHLQDELADLEGQLHAIDLMDADIRRGPNGTMPASRRREITSSADLYNRKQDVLGKIGYKLCAYNQVMMAFKKAAGLPKAAAEDIHQYRSFLAGTNLLVFEETKFLDYADDLVSLGDWIQSSPSPYHAPAQRGVSQPPPDIPPIEVRMSDDRLGKNPKSEPHFKDSSEPVLMNVVTAVTLSLSIPLLFFLVISDFLLRMAVVAASAGLTLYLIHSSGIRCPPVNGRTDHHVWMQSAGYMVIIAIVARILH